jgi:hypothetical protein
MILKSKDTFSRNPVNEIRKGNIEYVLERREPAMVGKVPDGERIPVYEHV